MIDRRRFVAATLAAPAGAGVVLSQPGVPAPGRGDDAALVAAERRLTELRAQTEALDAKLRRSITIEMEDSIIGPLTDERFALEDYIDRTPCETLVGAVVKLRRLADEITIITGKAETEPTWVSARQILAVIEREISENGVAV